jgi:hypothetical protein
MPYCKKCGRKIKLGYSLCYDCHERQKRAREETIDWGTSIRWPFSDSGGHRDNSPKHVIVETREEFENRRRERVKQNRFIAKIFVLWIIPLLILYLSIQWFFDKHVIFISNGYWGIGISILWLSFSLYLRKRRGKWV